MPVFEGHNIYGGVVVKVTHYVGVQSHREKRNDLTGTLVIDDVSDPDEAGRMLDSFNREVDLRLGQLKCVFGEPAPSSRKPKDVLRDYGTNDIVVVYGYANHLFGFEAGKIAEAEAGSGKESLGVIESLVDELKRIPGHIRLSDIHFGVLEANADGRRYAQMITRANHPPSVMDICHIHVAEK
ncbi:MAG: hypothetical protein FJY76_00385 [Candidatus Aenigmarchaeota archaeon]|nr:hypothetical protein [Candidatus Aenigmarchaeota archaeon]